MPNRRQWKLVCTLLMRLRSIRRRRSALLAVGAVLVLMLAAAVFVFGRSRPSAATAVPEPPRVELAPLAAAASYRDPVMVRGKAVGATTVTVGDRSVRPGADGSFELALPHAPLDTVLVATNKVGEKATAPVKVDVVLPRIRAVHVTAYAWAYDPMREAVLDLAREGRIDTVELDIKDEDGIVGYDSQVPLARESGAASSIYDAGAALKQLHDMGLKVVGRIVAFRDPTLASWAWHNGHPDWVIQNPGGQPYSSGYGAIAFTNFASPEIRSYNRDLAVEAARLGFDGVMYDYIRRPDGSLSSMQFPGLTESPSESIANFLRDIREPIRAAGGSLGAAVFGIAATRPDEIAQDIPAMARYVDYLAPMLYPSHWHAGEYDVANPNAQPYDIVFRSLQDFRARTEGTAAQIIPWLQDFSLGVAYGDSEVRAQIDATLAAGYNGYFMWNPAVSYHAGGLPTN
ncbi:putative glycoside hydrolase [Nocardia sp. CDC160]|uniref:putative glycoside hydrolase n=1 Tax=Nocardia sp. CDC160 TaxID=3112166 RepID=UPI002DB5AD89|nr:putative glycoside hydrolase [Nocardia sp. CDC160]